MKAEGSEAEELWQFVQVDEYRVPESGVDRVRKGFLNVLSSLRRGTKQAGSQSPLDPEHDLRRLPELILVTDLTERSDLAIAGLGVSFACPPTAVGEAGMPCGT